MKTFLSLAITLFFAVQCWSANPSFQSFDTNDFIAVSPTVKLRHSITNGTNIFNNYLTIYTNSTIINADTLITNTTTTIFNSFTTNITESSVIVNTNVFVENNFTTNFFDNSTIVISNTFVIITNSGVTIDGTNVATINPTIGRVPYKSGTNSFDDTAIFFIDTNTVGATEVDAGTVGVSNLITGLVYSQDTGLGYGILTNGPLPDFFLWTNNATSYQPTQPQGSLVARGVESYDHLTARGAFITQLSAFEFLIAGENDVDVSGESYVAIVGSDALATNSWLRISSGNGIGQHLFLVNSAVNSGFHLLNGDPCYDNPSLYVALKGGDWATTTYGDTIELLGTFNGWAEVGRFGDTTNTVVAELTINPTDNFIPVRSNSTAFADSPLSVTNGAVYQNYGGASYASLQTNGYLGVQRAYAVVGQPTTDELSTNGGSLIASSGAVMSFLRGQGTVTTLAGRGLTATNITAATSGVPIQRSGQLSLFGHHWNGSASVSPAWYISVLPPATTNTAETILEFKSSTNALSSSNIFSIDATGIIQVGGSPTNVLYRSGSDLVYTNGDSLPYLAVQGGAGYQAKLGVDNSGQLFLKPSKQFAPLFLETSDLNGILITDSVVGPTVDNSISLAGPSTSSWWRDVGYKGSMYASGFLIGTNYSRLTISHTGTNGAAVFSSQSSGTAGPARQFNFDVNGTNLYTLSPSVTDPILTVSTAAGTTAKVEAFGSAGYFTGDSFTYIRTKTGNGIFLSDTSIQPIADATMNLGGITSGENWFLNLGVSGTNFVKGFQSNTNFSRLMLHHGGTNDFGYVDSVGSGTAGSGKPILMRVGASPAGMTNMMQFDGTSGASTTGVLIYENGTAQRVTVGAADSGGLGFRVLRIPN